ncbi:MAG: 50S ribosomal protein L6 [Deltaproteobacteria bacterium]|nr:50S ribosomal protein L6 [Deltaproteobacteria bacterium]HCH63691.1 50S ribosomal protein L6 [Deltaproteobacteria bacterium]
MSRIGKKPVSVPSGVDVVVDGGLLKVKGPKGSMSRKVADGVAFEQTDGVVSVLRADNSGPSRAAHGLMRALLANMVHGVTKGFSKELEIIGVGYKAETKGRTLVMNLGFSHPINYPFPDGIDIVVNPKDRTKVAVHGIDKEVVGQVAAELRGYRPPDSYKGKGVRYVGETVRLKAGKSGQ